MSKHTPGPWKVMQGHTERTWFVVYKTRETKQRTEAAIVYKRPTLVRAGDVEESALASIESDNLNYRASSVDNLAEAEANARLIAAAPELLLACQGALNAFRLAPHVDKQQAIDYLVETITKATGGAE